MRAESVQVCAGLLAEYQGVVVHDLRGDLNGLLLTVDYLRRQVAARPDLASLLGDTLGDLGHIRGALNRTLGELDLVGQARRVLIARSAGDIGRLNLVEAVTQVVQNQVSSRAERRGVIVATPPPANIQVRIDPALLQLALQRMLCGWVDLARDTRLTITVERRDSPAGSAAVVRAAFDVPQPGTHDAVARSLRPAGDEAKSGPVAALRLARCLMEDVGGSVRGDGSGREIAMELPDGENVSIG